MRRALGLGLLWGLAWGVVARGFMRLFSDEPGFSWAGTGFVVGLSVLLFTGLSLVRGARLAGRSRWWRLAPVPGLLLLAGPGLALAPALLGGLVAGPWRDRVRHAIVAFSAVGTTGMLIALVAVDPTAPEWTTRDTVGLVVYTGCALALAAASSEWSRRGDTALLRAAPSEDLLGR